MQNTLNPLENHAAQIQAIAAEVRARAEAKEPLHIYKGGVHHFVPLPGDKRFHGRPVDISRLNRILAINRDERTCTAEPGVTFAELVRETLQHGLIPMVVPELEGITVGGAVAGCSVESLSYRYGGFHDSCIEYEVVGTAGEVITCSREKEPMLFEMIHGSYGTLGILTRLTFRLIPAKRYVRMEYRKFKSFPEFRAAMYAECKNPDAEFPVFIDGIIHSPTEHVLCLGKFVDQAPYLSSYRWLDIFYKSTRERAEDYLTTEGYCFRYDTECHWLTKTVPVLENKAFRLLFGKLYLGSTKMIQWSKRVESLLKLKKRPDVVCDVFIPARRFDDFWNWYEKDYRFFPLWIIPYQPPRPYGWISDGHASRFGDDMLIDCAVYGKVDNDPRVDASEELEKKTYELGGIKTLISRNHYTRERFWEIYNRPNYDAAKSRLDPMGAFPGLYEKFHRDRPPVRA